MIHKPALKSLRRSGGRSENRCRPWQRQSYPPENACLHSASAQADLHAILANSGISPTTSNQNYEAAVTATATGRATVSQEIFGRNASIDEISSAIKAKIASHPRYPRLLEAYIECQKVGAPPEVISLLDEIHRDGEVRRETCFPSCSAVDPELDEFMETYCNFLVKYKKDLARPFDEATAFLNSIEMQLNHLSQGTSRCYSDEAAASSDEELSGGEMEVQESAARCEDRELKDRLLRKYSGCLSSLKQEFSKKKKKGKLPKEARQALLDWWELHYKWPYPTEADKIALAESTGLDQKQINNWFINQRKRHWKPSENMPFAGMDTLRLPFHLNE